MRFYFAVLFVLWIALMAALTSCRTVDQVDLSPPAFVPAPTAADAVFAVANGYGPAAARLVDAGLQSNVEVIQPPSSCRIEHAWNKGHAVHINAAKKCVAGCEFVAVFQQRFTSAPGVTHRPAWLLVSTEPGDPISMTSFGLRDCWLMLSTNPKLLHSIAPQPGSIVTQGFGRLVLRWTPSHSLVGTTFYVQMVWAEPGTQLMSPMLKVTVGTR